MSSRTSAVRKPHPSIRTVDPRADDAGPVRERRLPAVVLPAQRDDRRGWTIVSGLLHLLVIVLLILSGEQALHVGAVTEKDQGAGGAGPQGGGGGGHQGTGGVETVHYVAVRPAPAPQAVAAVTPPPVVVPPKPPVLPPPEVAKPPDLPVPKIDTKLDAPKAAELPAATPGTGGGTGHDGSAGNGPGSGGGVGTGEGTGRGSGTGPGTGGGAQANYPPTPTEIFLPPWPTPSSVKGFHLVAEFDVDDHGKVLNFKFTPTRDGSYNKRLDEVLKNFKFRPGTKPDGTPIRMKTQITYDF